jgi:hypothetical protein
VHIYRQDMQSDLEECRELLATSPDNEFVKLRLLSALLCIEPYAEVVELARKIMPDGVDTPKFEGPGTRYGVQRESNFAIKRSRHIYKEEARQIPGKDSYRMTMEAHEMGLRLHEEELAIEPDKSATCCSNWNIRMGGRSITQTLAQFARRAQLVRRTPSAECA